MRKNGESLWDLWNKIKGNNIHIMGNTGEEGKKNYLMQ